MRNVLEEFHKDHHGGRRPTILGLREHIFTGRSVFILSQRPSKLIAFILLKNDGED